MADATCVFVRRAQKMVKVDRLLLRISRNYLGVAVLMYSALSPVSRYEQWRTTADIPCALATNDSIAT